MKRRSKVICHITLFFLMKLIIKAWYTSQTCMMVSIQQNQNRYLLWACDCCLCWNTMLHTSVTTISSTFNNLHLVLSILPKNIILVNRSEIETWKPGYINAFNSQSCSQLFLVCHSKLWPVLRRVRHNCRKRYPHFIPDGFDGVAYIMYR